MISYNGIMDYTDEDIQNYIEAFPGDCILYYLEDNMLNFIGCSGHVPETFGLSREEYLSMRKQGALAGVFENDREYVLQTLQRFMSEPGPVDIYFRIIHKSAGFVWLHTKAKIIGSYQGKPVIAVEYLNAAFENENIHNLLDNDKSILYVCETGTWEILYANQGARERWGRSSYVGKKCYELTGSGSQPCRMCAFWRLENGHVHIEEIYDKYTDRWYQIDCHAITWYGRNAFYQRINDITDLKRNKALLEADNSLIRRIARTVFEFIAIIDVANRTIRYREVDGGADHAAPALCINYDENSRYAQAQMVIPEEREYCRRCADIGNLVNQLEKSDIYSFTWTQPGEEGRNYRKQLTYCWLDENHSQIVAIKSDITASYKQEQKQMGKLRDAVRSAEQANQAKSEFLSRMSHDMRTPLNGILGLTGLLSGKTNLNEIREGLFQMELSGKYLLDLINDILDVGKIDNGLLELHPVVCDGKAVLENIIRLLRPDMEAKNIHFCFHADYLSGSRLYMDVGRVEQVVLNILGNAVKFTPEGGNIGFYMDHISCEAGIHRIRVTVKDNGIGISPEFLPKIFDPFSQEYSSNKSEYEGTGLGMTIAKKIVEMMGGQISVTSEPGEGTECTFTLDLPVASEQQCTQGQAAYGAEADLSCLCGKRILLCEDNILNAEIATCLLEMKDIVVDWVENGRMGVERFQAAEHGFYDAVLMDIRMPVMDGLEAARTIRTLTREDAKNVPIIALTANAFDEDRENSFKAGMNAHLTKPINTRVLYETLARHFNEG